jgi:predicted RNase H-like HicB family nuclease
MRRFTATLQREDDWFVAQCREIDVASQGRSEAEAVANLQEALALHLEDSGEELEVLVSVA